MPLLRILQRCGTTALVCTLLVSEGFAAVTVYYFNRTERGTDCLLIEQMSADVLKENFPRELSDGRLVWRPTNLDLSENTRFVFDYDLSSNELVVVRGDESRLAFNKLPGVWNLVQQPEQFRLLLADLVRESLAQPN